MGISAAIPTFNRAAELRLTLESMLRLELDGDNDFELIVIDNNSTDSTPEVVASYVPRFQGRLRYASCELQGLCHARNLAIRESRFGVLALLDDDVEVDSRWFQALVSAYTLGDVAAVGGRAYLIYPSSRPCWLTDRDEGLLSKVEHGPVRRHAGPDELFGLNLSFRKEWLTRVGGFRTDLDRVGKCLLSGGETELLERLERAGGLLLYEPAAIVGHRVAPERLSRRWFWSRVYWGARGEARRARNDERAARRIARVCWYTAKAALACMAALAKNGPRSAEFFTTSKVFAAWIGRGLGTFEGVTARNNPPPQAPTARAEQCRA